MKLDDLVEQIRSDTDCLWAIISRLRRGEGADTDPRDGIHCYCRLKAALNEYELHAVDILDSAYLWFAAQVLHAFEDIYERFVVNAK